MSPVILLQIRKKTLCSFSKIEKDGYSCASPTLPYFFFVTTWVTWHHQTPWPY